MKKLSIILLVGLLLLASSSPALAEDGCTSDCDECTDCQNMNYYYIIVAAIIIFLVFFWLRNRAPVMKKPVETENPAEPVQREGKD